MRFDSSRGSAVRRRKEMGLMQPNQADDPETKEWLRKKHRNDKLGGVIISLIGTGLALWMSVEWWLPLVTIVPFGLWALFGATQYMGYSYTEE